MTDKTEAQILAERCEESAEGWECEIDTRLKAADELRRLDAENVALRDALADLQSSVDFYKRRCDLLQKWQSQMRDPERIIVCDILANGLVMPEGGRYALSGTAPARVPLTDEQIEQGRHDTFSTNNPFCPCDSKTMRKAVRWAERKHGITGDAV